MRPWVVLVLAVPAFAGCLGDGEADPRIEGFRAVYELAGARDYELVFDGPVERYDADLTRRLAYRLREIDLANPAPWQTQEAEYFDGAGARVRNDGCGVISVGDWSTSECESFGINWRGGWLPGWDMDAHGAYWPLIDSQWLDRSWKGDTLVIKHLGTDNVYGGNCFEYEGRKPVPVRSCSGHLRLVAYERWDLPTIPAWPVESPRAARGPHANDLFPDADLDLMGLGFSSLEALTTLRTNSDAAAQLASGCVLGTLLQLGGAFARPPQDALLEGQVVPLADVRFTVQDAEGTIRDHTVHWVQREDGERSFSGTVTSELGEPHAVDCAFIAAQPWPSIGAAEFLAFSHRVGNPGAEGFEAKWDRNFFSKTSGLHYDMGTHVIRQTSVILNAMEGRLAHLSNHGGVLDPEGAA